MSVRFLVRTFLVRTFLVRTFAKTFLLSLLVVPAAGADESATWMRQGEERFVIAGGLFLPFFNTSLSVDRVDGDGTSINLETDLGYTEDVTTGWVDGTWRFKRRHRLTVAYFRFVREAGRIAERELTIGDEVYPAGATLDSRFAVQTIPIAYRYSFLVRDTYELAGSIGVHWWVNDFSASGSISLGNADGDASTEGRVQAPMPLIGVSFEYWPAERWSVGAHGEGLALDIQSDVLRYSGSFVNLSGSAHYWLYNQLAVGAALNYFSMDFDVNDDRWKGALDYDYIGPQIYAVTRF